MMLKKIITSFKKLFHPFEKKNMAFFPRYRVIEIRKNDKAEYLVKIQIINKNIFFNTKPEELLADDHLVNQFSPCDIRTLTYLGYLGINSPKYKILAKHLLAKDNKFIFLIKEKGNENILAKTIEDIMAESNIDSNFNANDAHLIGYTLASESIKNESKQKEELIKEKLNV